MHYFKLLIPILTLTLVSCAMPRPVLDSNVKYQRDLKFHVQYFKYGKWSKPQQFRGVGVIPYAEKLKFTLFAIGRVDMMVLSSCHREIKVQDPKTSWWKKGHVFEFSPIVNLETNRPCPIKMGVYEKNKGRHGWAMVALESSVSKLKASTKCNGKIKTWGGTSFCQAKAGLIQILNFDRKVETTFYGECKLKRSKDGKHWEYQIPKGNCILYFIDSKDENVEHAHYTYGYDSIPIR